jgi:hypothetical protein
MESVLLDAAGHRRSPTTCLAITTVVRRATKESSTRTYAASLGGVSVRTMKAARDSPRRRGASVHDVSVIVGTARRWAAISAGGNVRHAGAGRGFRTRGARAAGASATGRR